MTMTTTSMPVHPDLEREFEMVQARAALLALAETAVAEHAARKCDTRTAAVLRIMAQPAPSGKPHSWSSAEALRELDAEYAAWKRDELRLAQARGTAETALFCARLRAEYLSRTLPPTAIEVQDRDEKCEHGVLNWTPCAACEAEADIIAEQVRASGILK